MSDRPTTERSDMDWRQRLLLGMRRTYGVESLDEIEPVTSPGYWQRKAECRGECGLGHRQPMRHTLRYIDSSRDGGRFASPYRTWRDAQAEATP